MRKQHSSRKSLWRALLLTFLCIAAGWYYYHRSFAAVTVRTGEVSRGTYVRTVYASGRVVADRKACLAPAVSGRVVEISVNEGDSVHRGQVLIKLDDRSARLQLAAAENRLLQAEIDLQQAETELVRQEKLQRNKVGTDQAYDTAKSTRDRSLVQRNEAKNTRDLNVRLSEDHTLVAPFDGIIVQRDISVGNQVSPDRCVVSLVDHDSRVVEAEVDERDIARIHLGQSVVIAFDALPEKRFEGEVGTVIPSTDPITRTIRVRIAVEDLPDLVQDGMTATVNIIDEQRENALLIPSEAIIRSQSGTSVMTVNNGRVSQMSVVVEADDGKKAEINEGAVHEGALVVLSPPETLSDGRRIVTGT